MKVAGLFPWTGLGDHLPPGGDLQGGEHLTSMNARPGRRCANTLTRSGKPPKAAVAVSSGIYVPGYTRDGGGDVSAGRTRNR